MRTGIVSRLFRQLSVQAKAKRSTSTPSTPTDIPDKIAQAVGSKNLLLATAGFVGAVAFLPFFSNTREGFLAGLRYEPSKPTALISEVLVGGVGLLSGLSVTSAYIKSRAVVQGDPLILATRLPYGVLGGLIGASLCFALSSQIVRISFKVGKTVGYAIDGVGMDIQNETIKIARPWDNQNETYNGNSNARENTVENSRSALDRTREEMKVQESTKGTTASPATPTTSTAVPAPEDEELESIQIARGKHLDNLITGLVALRQQEKILKQKMKELDVDDTWSSNTASTTPLLTSMRVKLITIQDEKQCLKQEGMEIGCARISQLLNRRVQLNVDELSNFRIEQQKLALVVANHQATRAQKRTAMESIRLMDQQKQELKSNAWNKFGTRISYLAVTRTNWRKTIEEYKGLGL